jgi:hypothetical protein
VPAAVGTARQPMPTMASPRVTATAAYPVVTGQVYPPPVPHALLPPPRPLPAPMPGRSPVSSPPTAAPTPQPRDPRWAGMRRRQLIEDLSDGEFWDQMRGDSSR